MKTPSSNPSLNLNQESLFRQATADDIDKQRYVAVQYVNQSLLNVPFVNPIDNSTRYIGYIEYTSKASANTYRVYALFNHYTKATWRPDAIDFGSGSKIADLVVVRDEYIDTIEADSKLYGAISTEVQESNPIEYDGSLDSDDYEYYDDYCDALTRKRYIAAKDGDPNYNDITKKKKKYHKF